MPIVIPVEKELHRQQERQQVKHAEVSKQAEVSASVETPHCHNCGAPLPPGAAFCEECGAPQGGNGCVNCGAEVPQGTAICPVCGHPATTRCTYCGSQMSAGDAFCPECGNPRGGIVCPQCNTLNFRSFCRKCNHPLNPMALYAVEEARRDPRFIKAKTIADEIGGLEDEIKALEILLADRKANPPEPEKLLEVDDSTSDSARRLLEEFEKLSGQASAPKPKPAPARPRVVEADAQALTVSADKGSGAGGDFSTGGGPDTTFGAAAARLEKLREQYAAKTAELQRALDEMVPPEDAPPEIKRNFACARMITTYSTETRREKARVCWICNRCQIRHANPSECGVAEFGGRWEVTEITHTYEVKSTHSINI